FDLAARWVEWVSGFEVSRAGYETTVRFAPGAIPLLPRVFGESLRNAGPPDPDGWVTLHLTFENENAACYNLLTFGTWAEVIEPAELRDQIVAAAGRVITFYTARNEREQKNPSHL
ncbi:MAG: WYL domain-containing protein, partial [Chloroflexi bacterium]|nr:WYL domain-containing protein [Chloroflexota bacterium]